MTFDEIDQILKEQEVGFYIDHPVVVARAGYQVYARVVIVEADEGRELKLAVNAWSARFTKSYWEIVYDFEVPRVVEDIKRKYGPKQDESR